MIEPRDIILHLLARHDLEVVLAEFAVVLRELDQPRVACVIANIAAAVRDARPPGCC